MMEPYGSAIEKALRNWAGLGLTVASDCGYQMTLASASFTVTISAEKYYHPSISASLTDRSGITFEVGLAEKILAGQASLAHAEEPRAIKGTLEANSPWEKRVMSSDETQMNVERAISRLVEFVSIYGIYVCSKNQPFLAEYRSAEQALLARFGVR